jgi:hypothetical protein
MTWIHLIDWATGAASFAVKFIGYPAQLRTGQRRRRGVSPAFAATMCISYALWVVHGLAGHDLTEVLSQGTGVLTTGVLLAQALILQGKD